MKKQISDNLVGTIKKFGDYIEKQGGKRVFLDKLAEPIQDQIAFVKLHHTKVYLSLGCDKAMHLSGAEQIIDRGLQDGMSRKKFYKDIYQDVKGKVKLFAELHGQSEIILKRLE